MFLGEFEHMIDDKGRLAIPARFREQLHAGLIVTRGFDACLIGFPRFYWDGLAAKVSALPLGQPGTRDIQRRLFSGAADVEFDRQGRILVPQNLRGFAGIQEQIIIAGMNEYFEIWARERWEAVRERFDNNSSDFADQLATLGI
ncbi:MAG: division/cell wall cluster transcriptional repressor MraZ [Roseiflexaceae bacterium]